MDVATLHAQIADSNERQKEWGTDNFIGFDDETDVRGMTEDELTQELVEQMGLGIIRQGGNY